MGSVLGAGVTDAVRGQATRPCYSSHVMPCHYHHAFERSHNTSLGKMNGGSVAVENSQDLEFVCAPA